MDDVTRLALIIEGQIAYVGPKKSREVAELILNDEEAIALIKNR